MVDDQKLAKLAFKYMIEKNVVLLNGTRNEATLSLRHLFKELNIPLDQIDIPELHPLLDVFDLILIKQDGYAFNAYLFLENSQNFQMSLNQLMQIGEPCSKYTGRVQGQKLPVGFFIITINASEAVEQKILAEHHKKPFRTKVSVMTFCLQTKTQTLKTNATLGGLFMGRIFLKSFLKSSGPTALDIAIQRKNQKFIQPVEAKPLTTFTLALLIIAAFIGQVLTSDSLKQPESSSLIERFATNQDFVLIDHEYYRMISYGFFHLGFLHIILNLVALIVIGLLLERVIGHFKFLSVFMLSLVAGAVLSLLAYSNQVMTVGASGGIMGLIACCFVVSFYIPPGDDKMQMQMQSLYMLVPSLLPFLNFHSDMEIDYAAHTGGALIGAVLGFTFYKMTAKRKAA